MDESEQLESAIRNFNGHPLDWQRVDDYIWARHLASDRIGIDEVVRIVEAQAPSESDDLWRAIEHGVQMLDYLRTMGRI